VAYGGPLLGFHEETGLGYAFGVPQALAKGFAMRGFFPSCPAVVAAALTVVAGTATAQMQMTGGQAEIQTVNSAKQTLDEFSGLAIESIPPAMFGKAEGVAIFPDMIKGGFILGVNYGRGVLLVRRPDRTWSPPVMVTMGGGSLGFQAGVQSADIVLIFATPRSLNGILNGQKVTLGADASVALGPIGRQANAGTDARLGAEIYSYARSRGLFLGVSINGADLSVDNNANAMLYGRFGVTPADVFAARGLGYHEEVKLLIDDLNARSQAVAQAAAQIVPPPVAAPAVAMPQPVPPPAPPGLQPVGGFPTLPQPPAAPQPLPQQPVVPVTGATDTPYEPAAPPLVPIK
jgi:lipid-binding SYLF domain-containing protein